MKQLGAGIKLDQTDASSILEAVNKIFMNSTYQENASLISESFKRSSGAKGAADKILQVSGSSV